MLHYIKGLCDYRVVTNLITKRVSLYITISKKLIDIMQMLRDDLKGLVKGKKFGAVDGRVLRMLNTSILVTQPNGKDILYFCGKFIGAEFVRTRKVKSIDDVIKVTDNLLKKMKLGSIEGITKRKNGFLLNLKECAFCNPRKDGRCWMSAGIVAGISSEGLGMNYSGKLKDQKKSKDICTFEFKFV